MQHDRSALPRGVTLNSHPHFISGLPRSGSTLLAALLRQNPRFHAGLVGFAYDALKQACYGAQADRLLLVQYETLVSEPAKVMQAIYAFLGETPFAHDFEQVDYDVTEFDRRAGTPGLHTVRGKVHAEPRQTVLPPDLFRRFANDAFWRDPKLLPRGLRII